MVSRWLYDAAGIARAVDSDGQHLRGKETPIVRRRAVTCEQDGTSVAMGKTGVVHAFVVCLCVAASCETAVRAFVPLPRLSASPTAGTTGRCARSSVFDGLRREEISASAGTGSRRAHRRFRVPVAETDLLSNRRHRPFRLYSAPESVSDGVDAEKDEAVLAETQRTNADSAKELSRITDALLPASEPANNDDDGVRGWLRKNLFLGIDPTPDVIAIATIYFVEGALGLARLAQTFLLKDELHLGPAELSALTGIFALPWTIKPLYGFISDGFPLFGSRRRSYLILAGIVGCASYTLLGNGYFGMVQPENMVAVTVASCVVSSACIAFSDVVADGIVVQKTRDSSDPSVAGGLQSLCWGSAAIGGLLSAYFSGSLLEIMKPQDVFALTAALPLVVASIALLIEESQATRTVANDDRDPLADVKIQVSSLWQAIKQPSIYKPALFLFLWQSTPTSDGAFLYFTTNELGFGPEFLGRARLVSAAAGLFGVWLYNQYLKDKPIKDILLWSSIASAPLGMTSLLLITHANRALGIPDGAFILGDDVILSILGEIAFLPTLVLAARLCPPGVEAVLFATLMSINNGAGTLGTEVGALLTKTLDVTESNFDNLALLTVICNLTSLYPLLFIGWLDGIGSLSEQEIELEQEDPNGTKQSSSESQ